MDDLQVFGFDGENVRVIQREGEPWFVARDVAAVLGYSNVKSAIDDNCRGVATSYPILDSLGRMQEARIISESDLYRLIIRSKLPAAERFEKWVMEEVIPSIRKRGGYLAPSVDFSDPDNIQALLDSWKADRKRLEEANTKIAIDAPKVEFYEQVTDSTDAIDIGEAVKVLNMGIGRNKLFEILRGYKILMPNNQPYQKYIDAGFFRVVEVKWQHPNGDIKITLKPIVYQRGLEYIRKVINAYNSRKLEKGI